MIDDTREPSSQRYNASFTSQLAGVNRCRITRNSCYAWAANLKYLAYDDSHESVEDAHLEVENLKDEKGKALDVLPNTSNPNNNQQDQEVPKIEQREERSGENLPYSNIYGHSCYLCEKCPEFPTHKKTTSFQLVQFGKPGEKQSHRPCAHYIAVSYCWPKDDQGNLLQLKSTYSIATIGSDGNRVTRTLRAPDQIVDRAVECAKALNIRLIWLDQECLPQDESEEHATGVQAMDMVYQQARVSIGLIDQTVITQGQLDAIAFVLGESINSTLIGKTRVWFSRSPSDLRQVAQDILNFLDAFADDPFNSRAWILQEMFSAEQRAVLLFKCKDGSYYQESNRALSLPQFNIPGVFNILLEDMVHLISRVKAFSSSLQNTGIIPVLSTKMHQVMEKLRFFHPQQARSNHWFSSCQIIGGASYGPRKRCNAAVALTYLSRRHNYRVTDRLAIFANLCDYEIRLDIPKIEKQCQSLATCIFALAFINGDLSLFIPEVYHRSSALESYNAQEPFWMIPFHQLVSSVYTDVLRAGLALSLRNGNRYEIQGSRIILPGYLWKVNRQIDLRLIQYRLKSAWNSLKRCRSDGSHHISHEVGSSEHVLNKLSDQARRKVFLPNSDQETVRSQLNQNRPIYRGQQIATPIISGQYINRDTRAQIKLSLILCHILAHLHYALGETGVANSIWHSIRADVACVKPSPTNRKGSKPVELPDEVGDVLTVLGKLPDIWEAFHFDRCPGGGLRQLWIVERIMRDGYLWVGEYVKHDFGHNHPGFGFFPESSNDMQATYPEKGKSKIIARQLTSQMMANALLAQLSSTSEDNSSSVNRGAMTNLGDLLSSRGWTVEAEEIRAQKTSLFDVDGPCEVFVPFDHDLEILPRASHRSMDYCWIVLSLQDQGVEHEPPVDDQPDFLQGQRCASETAALALENQSCGEQAANPSNEETDHAVTKEQTFEHKSQQMIPGAHGTLRVIGRVRGAWECMYQPLQSYTFV